MLNVSSRSPYRAHACPHTRCTCRQLPRRPRHCCTCMSQPRMPQPREPAVARQWSTPRYMRTLCHYTARQSRTHPSPWRRLGATWISTSADRSDSVAYRSLIARAIETPRTTLLMRMNEPPVGDLRFRFVVGNIGTTVHAVTTNTPTTKELDAIEGAIVLAARWIVPFHSIVLF